VKLLDSLLDAIVRLEGDALVMHVGEKPYVVTATSSMNAYRGPLAWGQVELSSRVLTFDAVSSMLVQILPVYQQNALTEFGAIEHEIPSPAGLADRFTVIAARGGEDVWLEVRRRPIEMSQGRAPDAAPQADSPIGHVAGPSAAASHPEIAAVSLGRVASAHAADARSAVALAEAPPAARVAEPPAEQGTQEMGLVEDVEGDIDEPVAEVEPEAMESIVVAIPGHDVEKFELDDVSDSEIQVIDDEPQGVPTEEEVDAMLGTAGPELVMLGDEVVARDDVTDLPAIVDIPIAEPAFELSPPPMIAHVEDEATAADAPIVEAAVGTPLFSDEAVLAAAAAPVAEGLVAEISVVETPVAEAPATEEAPVVGMKPAVEDAPAGPPPVEHAPIVETTPAAHRTAIVETWPVDDHMPVVEMTPTAVDAPVSSTWPVADHRSIVEMTPVVEMVPVADPVLVAVAASSTVGSVAEATPVVAESSFEAGHVETMDVGTDWPAVEELSARWPEDEWQAVDEKPADVKAVNTWNAVVEPAVSEPTPQLWTPIAAEIPMEVTPELGQQEPTVDSAVRAASVPAPSPETPQPTLHAEITDLAEDEPQQAVIVPLARAHIKPESASVPFTPSEDAALMHTLRVAAARGASTVYVVAQSKPMIRIDGEIGPLESEAILTAADVERLVMELAPPRRRDALQNGPVEWLCEVPEIGRVRCLTFRDHRGPGILFRMFPPRAISADQLGLTPEVQALCQQSDGLVLVTGARASGKSTLLNAFIDLINRTRSDHLITIESQIGFVHESRRSFVSQRESRGDAELAANYARAALREDPDVMMIEDLRSAELVSAALEAAESGRLVLASVPASSTIAALERLIEVFPADRRAKARTSLATVLRGVVAQVLLRRIKGGRVAAREILLNTPAVSTLVLEGKMFQLPVALDSGRRHGMVPLTDSLAGLVRDGTVHLAEAYRKALDRAALVALLKREGIDTSFAERLA
jgi:twitching motility protein PilT